MLSCITAKYWSPGLTVASQIANLVKRLYNPLKYIDEALNDEALIIWQTNLPLAEQKAK